MKQTRFWLTTIAALLCSIAVNAHSFEVGGIYYTITDDVNQIVKVTFQGGYSQQYSNEYNGVVTIPSEVTYNGITYSVTSIGNSAFEDCSSLTSITIPESVTSIGNSAFDNCRGLTIVKIPESVTSIGSYAFQDCHVLTSITIPKDITIIGDFAFRYCYSLDSIIIPKGVTSIGSGAFDTCSRLTSITLPEGVTSIGSSAFYKCSSLTSITIPGSVTSIGGGAFSSCSSLDAITLPEGVTSIGNSAFSSCSNLTSITIPKGVTSIANQTFHGCSSLTSITLPESVTSIGYEAFAYCSSLTSITIPKGVSSIANSTFYGCSSLTSITLPEGVTSIGDRVFSGCSSLTSITLPEGVTSIGEDAFKGCSLTAITIPESMTSIGSSAFEGCRSLTAMTIPESVTSIGSSAFGGCSSLTAINIPEGMTSIGGSVFSGCSSLTSITIPENSQLTSIGYRAFHGCSSLTSITIPKGMTSIGSSAFYSCSSLYKVINCSNLSFSKGSSDYGNVAYYAKTLWQGGVLTTIDDYQFYTVNGIHFLVDYIGEDTEIVLPDKYNGENYSIGDYAFYGCSSLTSITIPEGVTSIGGEAFMGTAWYDNQPDGALYLDNWLIEYKGILTNPSIEVKKGTRGIANSAFYGCSGLTSITIPESVTSIGDYAFSGCSNLTSITCEAVMPPNAAYSSIFSNVDKSIPIYVLASSMPAYQTAGIWSEFTNIQPIAYLLTYMVDDEVVLIDTIAYGTTINLLSEPTKEGYTFSGWSEVPELMPANDLFVSGSFIVNKYLVVFKIDDEVVAVDSVEYNSAIVVPETPEKEGHTFNGWGEVAETVPANDVTYESSYSVNFYLLSYMVDGEIVRADSVAYGTTITELEEPVKEGYTFSGWSEIPETMPANDVTISGTFTADFTSEITLSTLNVQHTTIYDLTGRKVIDVKNLKGGVYIVDGKKVVIK